MSASKKKKLRSENTAKLTERQIAEQKEAKKLKLYTTLFVAVLAVMVVVAICVGVSRSLANSGIRERKTTALTVGDHNISNAELGYFYMNAVNTFINYDLPLRKVFNKMSFLLRYDMMTDQSDAKTANEETGRLTVTDYKRQRLTGGITFSLSKAFRTDLRLNYEKYFYAKNSIAKESEQDKVVLELMVRF